MDQEQQLLKARDCAFRLLKFRQRSTQEIRQRLEKSGFGVKIINQTVAYLKQLNYLNDEDFARFWLRSRMESHPAGWPLLCYQLRQKGIAEEVVEKVSLELGGQYDQDQAAKQLVALLGRRYQRLNPLKRKKRLYDYLRRRGFSQEITLQAIE